MCKHKLPIGLKPRFIAEEERIHEIFEAMMRFRQARMKIPEEWIEEFNELIAKDDKKNGNNR